jgi:hypothetical protein
MSLTKLSLVNVGDLRHPTGKISRPLVGIKPLPRLLFVFFSKLVLNLYSSFYNFSGDHRCLTEYINLGRLRTFSSFLKCKSITWQILCFFVRRSLGCNQKHFVQETIMAKKN